MRLMQRSWAALLVCATVWLVSCVDDNPVVPDQTYNAAEELAKETFNNDAWLDRTGVYSVGGFNDGFVISKNLVKTMTIGSTVYYYEYTTVGDRVVSIITDNTVETSVMRATTHSVYDLEYAK